jgi:hypothetical protein
MVAPWRGGCNPVSARLRGTRLTPPSRSAGPRLPIRWPLGSRSAGPSAPDPLMNESGDSRAGRRQIWTRIC